MTTTPQGILKGPKADRPAADELPDGTEWMLTDVGGGNGYQLTEIVDGSWESKPVHADEAHINDNQVYVQNSPPSNPSEGDVWIDNTGGI